MIFDSQISQIYDISHPSHTEHAHLPATCDVRVTEGEGVVVVETEVSGINSQQIVVLD